MSSEFQYDDGYQAEYSSDDRGFGHASRPNDSKKRKPVQGRKRGKAPSSFNGMHRRRRRKMAW